jgi:hypothetical protein
VLSWYALILFLSASVVAPASDSHVVIEVVKTMVRAEDTKDRDTSLASTWPDGRFTFAGERAKRWDEVPFSGFGVWNRTRLKRPTVSIHGNIALVTAEEVVRTYYDRPGGPDGIHRQYSGTGFAGRNRVELERRNGEWRVLNWFRSGRSIGLGRIPRKQPR